MAAEDQSNPSPQFDLKILSLNISGLRNKTAFLKHTMCKYTPDFVCLQETNINEEYYEKKSMYDLGLNNDNCFFNYPLTKSNGTAIICTNPDFKINNTLCLDNGRTIILQFQKNKTYYTIVNVYAPTNPPQRPEYYNELFAHLENLQNRQNLILAGDFNITLQDIDIQGEKGTQRIGRAELQNIVDSFNLKDAFRIKHPSAIETTFENKTHNRSARLDRIYFLNGIPLLNAFHIASTLDFTDHKGILAHFSNSNNTRSFDKKYTHWKFNDSLLDNPEFTAAIKDTIQSNTFDCDASNVLRKFDLLNTIFKRISISFSSKIEKQRNERLEFLNLLIKASESKGKIANTEHFNRLVIERDDILCHKYRGANIRSKIPIAQEKPTKAFLSIETGIQNSRLIKEINNENGNLVSDMSQIPTVFRDFYSKLYSRQSTESDVQNTYLNFTRKLSDEQREIIEHPITMFDLKKALFGMREEASPGPNGLTVKFFKTFFDDLAPLLLKLLDAVFSKGYLTKDFKLSYTVLLPKDSGSLLNVKNFRPISLLNISFKMITKALSNKIAPFIEDLVHPDQAAVIRGRSIQNHNHYIRDLISLAKLRGDHSCILSIDQQKAFDRVSHDWMLKVLKANNFGPNFLKWISILNDNASSHILLNKSLSSEYILHRGVRQGDVLSPILYILTLEPFLEKIRQDVSITGLHIPNKGTQKLLAFADDTNFFTNDVTSIKNIINNFEEFGRASGSLINLNKTKYMAIGEGVDHVDEVAVDKVTEIKLLGIFYTNEVDQTTIINWDHIINQMDSKINKIYYKQSSIFGRAILVNTFIEPKLIYPATSLDPPTEIVKSFKKKVRAFIFKGTIPRIRHDTLILTKLDGGINLHDIISKIISFRLKYMYKILDNQNEYPLACYFLSGNVNELLNNVDERNVGRIPQFYYILSKIYQKYSVIFHLSNHSTIYFNLIQAKKKPLTDQVKRIDLETDIPQIFRDIHKNIYTTPSQKQIIYRILFGITPTSEGLAKRHKRPFFCKFCSSEQETEVHIFYECPFLDLIKLELIKLLKQTDNSAIDLFKAVFLNHIQQESNIDVYYFKLAFIALYRDAIWTARNQATHKNYKWSETQLANIFISKIKYILKLFRNSEVVKNYVGGFHALDQ